MLCTETDYCKAKLHDCSASASCENNGNQKTWKLNNVYLVGFWNCTCNDGFSGDGTFCTDNEECVEGLHNCNVKTSSCSNTEGSYDCDCFSGYEKKNETCIDINECLSLDRCPKNFTCENTNGTFTCSCVEGTVFTGE